MKTLPLALFALILGGTLRAQTAYPPAVATTPTMATSPATVLTAEQLDQLLGPIALYPDALIALILPAATFPSDVVLAARYLNGGDPARVDEQPWDDSVRALAHYPDVVKWMDENLQWTQQLGQAFLGQPADVMNSVQRLRAEARAAGTLVDTPQQQVVVESDAISIMPTQPDVIYVPYYDPDVVYVHHEGYHGPFFSFSVGFPAGFWLGYNVDWGHRRLWVVDHRERERYWHDQRDWRRPVFPTHPNGEHDVARHAWAPPTGSRFPRPPAPAARAEIIRPAPISRGTPHTVEPRREPSPPANAPVLGRGPREAPHDDRRPDEQRSDDRRSSREIRDRASPAVVPAPPHPNGATPVVPNPGRIAMPPQPNLPTPTNPPEVRHDRGPVPAPPAPGQPAPQAESRRPPPKSDSDDDNGHRRHQSDNDRDR
jgi:hypothetical protein